MRSSTEGHISHVLSARMSSRPMGWCRQGADSLSRIRIYWKNGGDMLELVQQQKEGGKEGRKKKNISVQAKSCHGKKHSKANGKYYRSTTGKYEQPDFRENPLS